MKTAILLILSLVAVTATAGNPWHGNKKDDAESAGNVIQDASPDAEMWTIEPQLGAYPWLNGPGKTGNAIAPVGTMTTPPTVPTVLELANGNIWTGRCLTDWRLRTRLEMFRV